MESGRPEIESSQPPPDKPIRCAKCGHQNAPRISVCESCGAHLYVTCQNCGHRNERSRSRCVECRHKLHRSWFKRLARKKGKISLLQVALLVIGILLGLAVVVYFSELRVPEPESRWIPSSGPFPARALA